jgi:outer membrane protein OmpA-like peptidoglycan-associated protein
MKSAGILVAALALTTAGCATKKFVRNSMAPLEAGIHVLNRKSARNARRIKAVDRRSETGIAEAENQADKANEAAQTADQHAWTANQTAEKGLSKARQATEVAENIDNYAPSGKVTVLFGFNKSTLTSSDRQKLDALVQQVRSLKHYVLQVQGFTDTTGTKQYNLMLSKRRADAVVRYVTLRGNIPLVKIYRMGYGEDAPAHSNRTLRGRELNRRVTVTVMVPQIPGQESASANTSASSSSPADMR